jgi:hypothetical protein
MIHKPKFFDETNSAYETPKMADEDDELFAIIKNKS